MNEPVQNTPIAELLSIESQIENSIQVHEKIFGTIGNPDYNNYLNYLKGMKKGISLSMRVMDL